LFYLCIDLDDVPALARRLRLLSFDRAGLFSLHARDFLPTGEPMHRRTASPPTSDPPRDGDGGGAALKTRVLAYCAAHGVALGAEAHVRLVALPRLFGYHFNPVAFYLCAERDGTPRAAIAEVTNTFREVKPYFVPLAPATGVPTFRLRVPKHFYVSPFSSVEVEFDFLLRAPDARLAVRIDDYENGRRVLHSSLTGVRGPLTDARLAWFFLKYPLGTVAVMARIHWQALRLWLKRVPFFRKADAGDRQRDLFRPHPSIST
jgi:DUF1365 family protein